MEQEHGISAQAMEDQQDNNPVHGAVELETVLT